MNQKSGFWVALWVVLVVVTGFFAFGSGSGAMGYYGPWHGWGRMGGWDDDGYRRDGASGWHGMGPGMMGQYGMGMPGLDAGIGFGMAGGGSAMMHWRLPDLTSEQVRKIGQLQSDSEERHRSLMQQRWEAQARLNRLYAAEKRDWSAILSASRALFDLQRQQLDAAIDVQQKIDGLLTDSQRQAMARAWRGYGWMGGSIE